MVLAFRFRVETGAPFLVCVCRLVRCFPPFEGGRGGTNVRIVANGLEEIAPCEGRRGPPVLTCCNCLLLTSCKGISTCGNKDGTPTGFREGVIPSERMERGITTPGPGFREEEEDAEDAAVEDGVEERKLDGKADVEEAND